MTTLEYMDNMNYRYHHHDALDYALTEHALMIKHDEDPFRIKVCHGDYLMIPEEGEPERLPHAWVEEETDEGVICIECEGGVAMRTPKEHYYRMNEIDEKKVQRYLVKEALLMSQMHDSYGPWKKRRNSSGEKRKKV